jgi:class 3 adenylate cyclase
VRDLPSGTVTFLFTDLQGSTRLWELDREAMAAAVARHHELLENAVQGHGGVVFSYMGDGVAAAFGTALDAVAAAVDAQRAFVRGLGQCRAVAGAYGCPHRRGTYRR